MSGVAPEEAKWRDYWRTAGMLPIQFVNWLRDYLDYREPLPEFVHTHKQTNAAKNFTPATSR